MGALIGGVLMLFLGYPLIVHFVERQTSNKGGFNLGGTNATGQIANFASMVSWSRHGAMPDSPCADIAYTGLEIWSH